MIKDLQGKALRCTLVFKTHQTSILFQNPEAAPGVKKMVFLRPLTALGDFWLFTRGVFRAIVLKRFPLAAFLRQMDRVGVESLTVVNLCSFFIGMVLVAQIAALLARFGAKTEVSSIIGLSFVREIGPVFAAIMFTGRIGTGIAAELGSMQATEQIYALRVMGADPVARLVAPRVLASLVMLPVLTAIADLVGIFSGYLAAIFSVQVGPAQFLNKALGKLVALDVVSSMVKALCFGIIIGLIATYMGLKAERSTEAVGAATTRTMVGGVLGILFVDFILTKLFLGLSSTP
jgi:phospholipid/cholesterol/gamma-HCH transport system permease protein